MKYDKYFFLFVIIKIRYFQKTKYVISIEAFRKKKKKSKIFDMYQSGRKKIQVLQERGKKTRKS